MVEMACLSEQDTSSVLCNKENINKDKVSPILTLDLQPKSVNKEPKNTEKTHKFPKN